MPSLITDHPSVGPLLTERVQRAKLLDGMVRAVAEKGYAAATVADAVRLARVSRGTFYELFESKEACLAAAYRLGCEVLEERVSDAVRDAVDWRDELRLGIRTYLRTLEEEPVLCARLPARVARGRRGARRGPAAASPLATARRSRARAGRCRPTTRCSCWRSASTSWPAAGCAPAATVIDLEDTLVGCAVRLVAEKEDPWT